MPRLVVSRPDIVLVNKGVELRLSRDYAELEKLSVSRLFELLQPYPKATRFATALIQDPEVRADWDMADYLTVAKMHFSDHGSRIPSRISIRTGSAAGRSAG